MVDDINLKPLLCCEGDIRDEFEDFIKGLSVVKYSLDRDENEEYKQPAVFHMWTGFCLGKAL